jgi:hypothetical protein
MLNCLQDSDDGARRLRIAGFLNFGHRPEFYIIIQNSLLFARGFFLYSEDGGYTFLRNVGTYKTHTALQPRRLHSSFLKLKLIYDRQSVGQSVLVSGAHLGPLTRFLFSV